MIGGRIVRQLNRRPLGLKPPSNLYLPIFIKDRIPNRRPRRQATAEKETKITSILGRL
jgi:hypothetical protein